MSTDESTSEGFARVERIRFDADHGISDPDTVAREEPLEIQLEGESLAVVMRTPGHDRELVSGFLFTERVIERPEQLVSVHAYSRTRSDDEEDHVVRAVLSDDAAPDFAALRRNLFASWSCGVCGKATIENALRHAPPLADDTRLGREFFTRLPEALREAQPGFERTGGLHAAALFDPSGERVVAREDVGRHNAVDKVVGFALAAGRLPLAGHVLMVSGRISYEIVQKALAARIPVVAAVSAPTSLAVELAEASGIALVAFLRGRRFAVYGRSDRVVG